MGCPTPRQLHAVARANIRDGQRLATDPDSDQPAGGLASRLGAVVGNVGMQPEAFEFLAQG